MKSSIKTILVGIAAVIALFTGSMQLNTVEAPNIDANAYPFVTNEAVEASDGQFGASQINFVGGKVYTVSGAGITSSADTLTLTSFDTPVTDTPLVMTDFGSIGYGTIEPSSSARREFISFTGVTQNADGSATLTGVVRGLQFVSPYTSSPDLQLSHSGGSRFVISNPPQLYAEAAFKGNDEIVTGSWEFPTPLTGDNPATKSYVDSVVNGGTLSYDQTVVTGLAGATLAAGDLVYFDQSDAEWKLTDADDAATSIGVELGIAQGAGTDGNNITNGVLIVGTDSTALTGQTGGVVQYVSNTPGEFSTSPGTNARPVGRMKSPTEIYFDAGFNSALNPLDYTIYPTYLATSSLENIIVFGSGADGDVTIADGATTTLDRDMFYQNLTVDGVLDTNGHIVYVQDTLDGSGTIQFNGNDAIQPTGTIAGQTDFVGGTAATSSGNGRYRTTPGDTGGNTSLDIDTIFAVVGTTTDGGQGGDGGGNQGGSVVPGGSAEIAQTPIGLFMPRAAALTGFDFGTDLFFALSTTTRGYWNTAAQAAGGRNGQDNGGGGCSTYGPNDGVGGGAGASGGLVHIIAKNWAGTFTLSAQGGDGGNGGNGVCDGSIEVGGGGGGAGGHGGVVFMLYWNKTWTGIYDLSGGVGGTGGINRAGASGASGDGDDGDDGISYELHIANTL